MIDLDAYKSQLQDTVVAPMTEFWTEDCDFTKKDIAKCEALLIKYLTALHTIEPSDKEIMKQVKAVVLALNKLNEKTDYGLIETEEREAIWEIIQNSAVDCGLTAPADDITEEWREW